MNKLLLTLLTLLAVTASTATAETWSYEVVKGSYTNHDLSKVAVGTKSDIVFGKGANQVQQTWQILITAIDDSQKPAVSNDGNSPAGILIGAAAKPAQDITLYSGDNFENKTISKITVTACGSAASQCNYDVTFSVGDFSTTQASAITGNTEYELSCEPNAKGEIIVNFHNNTETVGKSKNAGIKFCSISVEYNSKPSADIHFSETECIATIGEDFQTPTLTNANNANVIYSSSDTKVATVSSEGTVTLVGQGTTTISADTEETEEYASGHAEYTLTVIDNSPQAIIITPEAIDENIDINKGGIITFFSENASKLKIELDSDNSVTVIEGDTYEHIATVDDLIIVTPIDSNGNDMEDLSAMITVTIVKAPECGEVVFNPTSGEIVAGTEISISAAHTSYFIFSGTNAQGEELFETKRIDGQSFTYSITEECTLSVTPVNADDVHGTTGVASYTIKEAFTDHITASSFNISSNTYKTYEFTSDNGISYKTYSNGVYATSSTTGPAPYFAIRSNDEITKSGGLIVTASNKVASKITIKQYSKQTTSRSVSVYGSINPYTDCSSISSSSLPEGSVKLGEAELERGTEVEIPMNVYYPYIMLLASSNYAVQMEEINITWEDKYSTPDVIIEHRGKLSEGGCATFTINHHKAATRIFYTHEAAALQSVGRRAPTHDSTTWTELTDNNTIEITTIGNFYVYATDASGKNRSDISSFAVKDESTTSLVEVEAVAGGEAEWFDLQGRRVAAPAKGGVYILRQGSKVSKRML